MRQAQWLLACGANDFGGTLINESISTSAGATHGQLQPPAAIRRAIRDAGRIPVERSTLYDVLRVFPSQAEPGEGDRLDGVDDPEAIFGSYDRLTRDERFRFRLPIAAP
jgi:FO synthase subunit 2